MTAIFAAVHESALGTKRTSAIARLVAAEFIVLLFLAALAARIGSKTARMMESKMLTWVRMDQKEVLHSIRTAVAAVGSLLIARFCRLRESYWAAYHHRHHAINS